MPAQYLYYQRLMSHEKSSVFILPCVALNFTRLPSNNINQFSGLLVNGQGTVQALLTDTIMKNDFNETLNQLKKSSFLLEEDLKALQKNFLFRKYFRQKEKKK